MVYDEATAERVNRIFQGALLLSIKYIRGNFNLQDTIARLFISNAANAFYDRTGCTDSADMVTEVRPCAAVCARCCPSQRAPCACRAQMSTDDADHAPTQSTDGSRVPRTCFTADRVCVRVWATRDGRSCCTSYVRVAQFRVSVPVYLLRNIEFYGCHGGFDAVLEYVRDLSVSMSVNTLKLLLRPVWRMRGYLSTDFRGTYVIQLGHAVIQRIHNLDDEAFNQHGRKLLQIVVNYTEDLLFVSSGPGVQVLHEQLRLAVALRHLASNVLERRVLGITSIKVRSATAGAPPATARRDGRVSQTYDCAEFHCEPIGGADAVCGADSAPSFATDRSGNAVATEIALFAGLLVAVVSCGGADCASCCRWSRRAHH